MPNPADIIKLMGMKNRFEKDHPKMVSFIKAMAAQGLPEDTVIEITVTSPEGAKQTANMKVLASDVEMLNQLKNMKP